MSFDFRLYPQGLPPQLAPHGCPTEYTDTKILHNYIQGIIESDWYMFRVQSHDVVSTTSAESVSSRGMHVDPLAPSRVLIALHAALSASAMGT